MPRVKAIILAAGLGTRLRPLTDRAPKCLLPIPAEGGRPVLDYWLDLLGDAGVRELFINTHLFRDQMLSWINQRQAWGCRRIHESYEPELLGSAGALARNAWFAEDADEVLVIYADNLSDVDLDAMLRFHRSHDDPMTMMLFRADNPRSCGIAELDERQRIVSFIEKPREPRSDLANGGVYVIDGDAFEEIARVGGFDFAFDVLPRFVGRMRGWVWEGYHRDIGTHGAYEQACSDAPRLLAARGADREGQWPAVFLDRDGTLIEHVHYLDDPRQVRIVPGAADSLRRLRRAGFRAMLVSNQSGVGRGLFTEAQLHAVNERMCELLADQGAALDGIYTCTIPPRNDSADRTRIEHEDRKPGPGMLRRAAKEHRLDLERSWMIGDMVSDVLAGHHAGCRGSIMVGDDNIEGQHAAESVRYERCRTLADAADLILSADSNQTVKEPVSAGTAD